MNKKKLKYNGLGRFIIIPHKLEFGDTSDVFCEWLCIYEEVKIHITNKITINGLKKHGKGYLLCYDKIKYNEENTSKIYNSQHIKHQEAFEKTINCNANYNCFGYCCFNSEFWVDLTNENLSSVMCGNKYVKTKHKPDGDKDFIIVYYDKDGKWIHIGKYDSIDKKYKHKLGPGEIVEYLTEDITNHYKECDMSKIKFYIKN